MESYKIIEPEKVETYIQCIRSTVTPNQILVNEKKDEKELARLRSVVFDFADHIKDIHDSLISEGITIEKDLPRVLYLLINPDSLEAIGSLYERILKNAGAYANQQKKTGFAIFAGIFAVAATAGVTFFAPYLLPAAYLYSTCVGGGILINTGILFALDIKNKRGELVKYEQTILTVVLDQFYEAKKFSFYTNACLTMIRLRAQARSGENNQRDNAIQFCIDQISNYKDNLDDISKELTKLKDCLFKFSSPGIFSSGSKAAPEVEALIRELKKENPENDASSLLDIVNTKNVMK